MNKPTGKLANALRTIAARDETIKRQKNCIASLREELTESYAIDPSAGITTPVELMRFEYKHPENGETHVVHVTRAEVASHMDEVLFEKLTAEHCHCEPIGETNVVECCCDEYTDEFKLVAEAPHPVSAEQKPERCQYQRGTIECRGDGYLWDADNDGYDPNDHSMPCPCCNPVGYLDQAKEEAESTVDFSTMGNYGTGQDIWLWAVECVRRECPEGVDAALAKIGPVRALVPSENGEESEERLHNAPSTTLDMAALIREHRIAVTPEHEGQWHADLYRHEAEPLASAEGDTPEAAVNAVIAACRTQQGERP